MRPKGKPPRETSIVGAGRRPQAQPGRWREPWGETPDTPPANATAQAMPGEFPWDPVPGVPQSTWISLEAESVDWKGIQL